MSTPAQPGPPQFHQALPERRIVQSSTVTIPPPDALPNPPESNTLLVILPIVGTILGFTIIFFLAQSGTSSQSATYILIGLPLILMGFVVSLVTLFVRRREFRQYSAKRESDYRNYLNGTKQSLADRHKSYRADLIHNNPGIAECLELAQKRDPRRLWSRMPHEPEFLQIRVGLGPVPSPVAIAAPEQTNLLHPDNLVSEAQRLAEDFRNIPDAPLLIDLRKTGLIGFVGSRPNVVDGARSFLANLATHHSPEDVKIALAFPRAEENEWLWARWLPHTWSANKQVRYLVRDSDASTDQQVVFGPLLDTLKQRDGQLFDSRVSEHTLWPVRFVFVLASPRCVPASILQLLTERGPQLGAHAIFLAEHPGELPPQIGATIIMDPSPKLLTTGDPISTAFKIDRIGITEADKFARALSPLRIASKQSSIPNLLGLFELFEQEHIDSWNITERWKAATPHESLAVPVGQGVGASTVFLDIHDDRHGPHGLVGGASRSGKTRFLECFITSLAANFPPDEVSFILIDFKGDDLTQEVKSLAHVANVLSNLEGRSPEEQTWIFWRVIRGLDAEIKKRQALLSEVGVNKISDYSALRRKNGQAHVGLAPIPRLVLIADELYILAKDNPALYERLVKLATLGGSLGIHLILSTQQPATVVTPQIWSNSRFRLAFRFGQAQDSQAVLQRPEAARIEHQGRAYVQVGNNEIFTLFQGPYGRLPYEKSTEDAAQTRLDVMAVSLNGTRQHIIPPQEAARIGAVAEIRTLIAQINQEAEQANLYQQYRVWADPLPKRIALSEIHPESGFDGHAWQPVDRWLAPYMGLLDDPGRQSQRPWRIDLGHLGNVMICGASVGSTRLPLRTIITSLALDHTPEELHIYGLDFGALSLRIFEQLPHVARIYRKEESKGIQRLFHWLLSKMDERKEWLVNTGYSNFTATKEGGEHVGAQPSIVVVIDNVFAFKEEPERLEELVKLAAEGAQCGIHLILAGDERMLQLSRLLEAVPVARIGLEFPMWGNYHNLLEKLPRDWPIISGINGRGLYYDGEILECQTAIPVEDDELESPEKKLVALVAQMKEAAVLAGYARPEDPGELPDIYYLDELTSNAIVDSWQAFKALSKINSNQPLKVPLGLDDISLKPISVDLVTANPHFVVIGPTGGGKSTALRTCVMLLATAIPPTDLQFVLFDSPEERLLPLQDLPNARYVPFAQKAINEALVEVAQEFSRRPNGAKWPAWVFIIDDFTLFTNDSIRSEWRTLASSNEYLGVYFLVSAKQSDFNAYGTLEKKLLGDSSGLIVGSHNLAEDGDIFKQTFSMQEKINLLGAGRGWLVRKGKKNLVQIATVGDDNAIRERINQITTADSMWTELYPPESEPEPEQEPELEQANVSDNALEEENQPSEPVASGDALKGSAVEGSIRTADPSVAIGDGDALREWVRQMTRAVERWNELYPSAIPEQDTSVVVGPENLTGVTLLPETANNDTDNEPDAEQITGDNDGIVEELGDSETS